MISHLAILLNKLFLKIVVIIIVTTIVTTDTSQRYSGYDERLGGNQRLLTAPSIPGSDCLSDSQSSFPNLTVGDALACRAARTRQDAFCKENTKPYATVIPPSYVLTRRSYSDSSSLSVSPS